MKKHLSLAALSLVLLTLTASHAMAQTTIPAANRAPGTYGPFGPFNVGTNNLIDIQFVSSNWSVAGGTFEMHCDLSTDGGTTWRIDDFSGTWFTGPELDRHGNLFIPHVMYDVPPGSQVRVTFIVGGKSINLGLTATTSVKP